MNGRWIFLLLAVAGCAGSRAQGPEAESAAVPKQGASTAPAQSAADEPRAQPLALVSGVWSPFTDQKNRPRIAIDIVEQALSRAGYAMQSHIVAPSEVMDSLEAGKFDGSEALWATEERKAHLEYSVPYLENRLVLLTRKGGDVTAHQLSELKGKKLGLVESYAYGAEVLEAAGPTHVFGKSDEDNLRALLKGEVDYILVDELLVYYLFAYDADRANELLSAGTHPLAMRGLHFVLQKNLPNARTIIDDFNAQIQLMIRDGSYNKLLKVDWLLADHDGDGQHEYILSGEFAGSAPPNLHYRLTNSAPLMTPPGIRGPHFLVGGAVYDSWEAVPQEYKVPAPLPEPIDTFKPGINLVLLSF